MIGMNCYMVYPEANLDLSKPDDVRSFCQTKMKVSGDVMQYNGKNVFIEALVFPLGLYNATD